MNDFNTILVSFGNAASLILVQIKYKIVNSSYDNVIAFKVCKVIKEVKEESWIVFFRGVYISHGYTVSIGFDVANNEAHLEVNENLFNLKIKAVIEKYA